MTKSAKIETTLAYVGGGSLNWARVLMADLIHDGAINAEVRLYDLDLAAAQRNADLGNRYSKKYGAAIRYVVAKSLEDALGGSEFVVISFLPGTFDDMTNDIDLPAREGIRQSVGDSVGPGGFIRSMRAIPAMVEVAEAIKRYCPQAYVCNLTNPMSVLTGALYAAFPEIRAWGECHEVTKLKHLVAAFANSQPGAERISYDQVDINVLGINHFTFVDSAFAAGRDWLPDYVEFARRHRDEGWRETPLNADSEEDGYFEDWNRVKFDLTARLGIAAAAGDRHLSEFVPASWYLDEAEKWKFGLTPVDWRRRNRAEIQKADRLAEEQNVLPDLAGRSEEALVAQIRALSRGETLIVNANLPNRGQVEGLPPGAIVETNVMFSGTGIHPIHAGRLPLAAEALVRPHAERQNILLQAVLDGDLPALENLFLTDPLVAAIGPQRGVRLFRSMVAATSHCLPVSLRLPAGA